MANCTRICFQSNIIPLGCLDPTAVDLLQYVPTPANGSDKLVTTPVQPVRGDQFTVKIDHRINNSQNLSFYYYFNDDHQISPFAVFQAAGANVPGFGSIVNERYQQWNISHTWTINNSTVNEFRFNYNREAQKTFQHPVFTTTVQNSCPAAPTWLTDVTGPVPCFSDGTPENTLGIHPNLGPKHEGLPFIQVSGGFTIGNNGEGELPQVGNSFQWSDNVSKVVGNHSLKFGGDVRRQHFDQTLYFDVNGEFFVDGTSTNTTGGDTTFSDYLLGLARFVRAGIRPSRERSQHRAIFVRARQLEDQTKPDAQLRAALGAEHSHRRHQQACADLPPRGK